MYFLNLAVKGLIEVRLYTLLAKLQYILIIGIVIVIIILLLLILLLILSVSTEVQLTYVFLQVESRVVQQCLDHAHQVDQ